MGFGGSLGVSLGIGNPEELKLILLLKSHKNRDKFYKPLHFPTAPGELFASKLEFNDFGVVAVDDSVAALLCLSLVSSVESCVAGVEGHRAEISQN